MKSFGNIERLGQGIGRFARRRGRRFYVLLAVIMAAFAVLDFAVTHLVEGMDGQGYDFVMRHRLSSPVPDPDILIVEIDEPALERVGRDHGRWPWPRAVLAEALANMAEGGASSIYVNVLLSDPDPQHPEADDLLAGIAASYPVISFAMTRLAPENDRLSHADAAMIPGAVPMPEYLPGPDPVAVIVPFRAEMQAAMGVNNLTVDEDGIVRRYRYAWPTERHALPAAAARLAGTALPADATEPLRLNWRNKSAPYARISFVELYETMVTGKGLDWQRFKNKRVIVGVTAPGISVLKPTSTRPLTDDNEILATAADDLRHGTSLQVLPGWIFLVVTLLMIALICLGFMSAVDQELVDGAFAASQTALLAVTLLSVSYSNHLIDLTQPFTYGLIYFSAARAYQFVMATSLRGSSMMWSHTEAVGASRAYMLVGEMNRRIRYGLTRMLERWAAQRGPHAYLYYDNAIGGLSGLNDTLAECDVAILFLPYSDTLAEKKEAQDSLTAFAGAHGLLLQTVELEGIDDVDELRHVLAAEVFNIAHGMLAKAAAQ
jgi:CHASE2 domain-containing sensor protein